MTALPYDDESIESYDADNTTSPVSYIHPHHIYTKTKPTEATPHRDTLIQSVIMFTIAALGCAGNVIIISMILLIPKFRRSATTFIGHQCVIDVVKSSYCVIFAQSLSNHREPENCNIIGISYIILTTASAYNLLALVVNEEFQLYHRRESTPANQNHCCIIFGVFIVWFTSILINLGVAFLPGNPEYNKDIGSCVFTYGIPRNLVLHSLWMILVSGAVVLSYIWLILLYGRIKNGFKKQRVVPISEQELDIHDSDCDSDADVPNQNIPMLHIHRRRVIVYIFMVTTFVFFWYPLFVLTLSDPYYNVKPKEIYQVLTMLAWSQPILTPLFSIVILHDMGQHSESQQLFVFHNQVPRTPQPNRHDNPTYYLYSKTNAVFSEQEECNIPQGEVIGLTRDDFTPREIIGGEFTQRDITHGGDFTQRDITPGGDLIPLDITHGEFQQKGITHYEYAELIPRQIPHVEFDPSDIRHDDFPPRLTIQDDFIPSDMTHEYMVPRDIDSGHEIIPREVTDEFNPREIRGTLRIPQMAIPESSCVNTPTSDFDYTWEQRMSLLQ